MKPYPRPRRRFFTAGECPNCSELLVNVVAQHESRHHYIGRCRHCDAQVVFRGPRQRSRERRAA